MTTLVEVRVNVATAPVIAAHLRRCDDAFIPRLSDRVEIDVYAGKIAERAMRFEAWVRGSLVGLVAAYIDAGDRTAFITTVSVDPTHQRQGIASRLLSECMAYVQEHCVARVLLEVDRENERAIAFYTDAGFTMAGVSDRTMTMGRDIQAVGSQP
ncbi:MAG TPA: GNAT family N-acetyltransferase [Candidatus Limnocylindrales bacterium]|nr:GNAT family N-acetyltransferase [Candidatus Limnocylindrales bacterium]